MGVIFINAMTRILSAATLQAKLLRIYHFSWSAVLGVPGSCLILISLFPLEGLCRHLIFD